MIVIKTRKVIALIACIAILTISVVSSPMTVLGQTDDSWLDFFPPSGMPVMVTADCNNGNTFAQEVSTYEGLNTPTLAGAKFVGWYLDEALTQPAQGKVDGTKVWAKWESTVCDYDTTDAPMFNILDTTTWGIKEHIGYGNSSVMYCNTPKSNASYPDHLTLYNPDGSVFKTTAGHTYSISLLLRSDDWTQIANTSRIAVRYKTSNAYDETNYPGVYRDANGNPAKSQFKVLYDNAVAAGRAGEGSFISVSFNIVSEESTPIYLMFRSMQVAFVVDNIKIVDLTAQKSVTFGDKTVSGYAGDKITYPNSEGDMNVVGWKTADGNAFEETVFSRNLTLTPDYRNIAITDSDVQGGTLNFKLRFEGVTFRTGSNGIYKDYSGKVTVKKVGIGSFLYPIVGIGVKVNGVYYSGNNFKYSVVDDNLLEVSVKNNTTNYSAEYKDIEGYIQYKDAFGEIKTLTSKISDADIGVRNGVGLSYNAAAGFGNNLNISYTDPVTGNYKLTWHDEFDSSEWDFNKWDHNTGITSGDYSDLYYKNGRRNSFKENGNMVLKSQYDSKNNARLGVRARTKYKFSYGYIETRVKVSNNFNSKFTFWLNNAGLFPDDPIQPSTRSSCVHPEIDVFEIIDSVNEKASITFHGWGTENGAQTHFQYSGSKAFTITDCIDALNQPNAMYYTNYRDSDGYITMGIERTSEYMRIYYHKGTVRTLMLELTLEDVLKTGWGLAGNGRSLSNDEKKALFQNFVYVTLSQQVPNDLEDLSSVADTSCYVDYIRIYE